MLQRRVRAQDEFLLLVQENIDKIYLCFINNIGQFEPLKACVGPEVTSSVGWIRIRDSFVVPLMQLGIGLYDYLEMVHTCFLSEGEETHGFNKFQNTGEANAWINSKGILADGKPISFNAENERCFKGFESSKPWEEIIKEEMDEISQCFEESGMTSKYGLDEMVKKMDGCFSIKTQGVTRSHLHKSLYVMHLQRCLFFIPQSQILILASSDLEEHPNAVMDKVHKYLGVSAAQYNFETDDLENIVEKEYNLTFSRGSRAYNGFQMKSNYAEMNDKIRSQLEDFFKPFNDLLTKVLGQNIFGEDSNSVRIDL